MHFSAVRDSAIARQTEMTVIVLTGLRDEARIVKRRVEIKEQTKKPIILCAASDPRRARFSLEQALTGGAARLLSFGIAGGLAPDFPSGAVIIADKVLTPDGSVDCDAAWIRQLTAALPAAHVGGIYGSATILATPQAKSRAYQSCQALACDMESPIVAEAARSTGLPFACLRVVCDPADFALPSAALLPLRENGTPDLPGILCSILRNPRHTAALLALQKHHRRAMRVLAQVARAVF